MRSLREAFGNKSHLVVEVIPKHEKRNGKRQKRQR